MECSAHQLSILDTLRRARQDLYTQLKDHGCRKAALEDSQRHLGQVLEQIEGVVRFGEEIEKQARARKEKARALIVSRRQDLNREMEELERLEAL